MKGREHAQLSALDSAFKMTEVGVIPEDWEVARVGDEFLIQLGKMLDSEKNTGVPKPFLGNRAVQWGRIDLSDIGVVKMTPSDLRRFRLRDGDLLVCEGGEIGRAAIWQEPIAECYYQKALHRLRPKHGYNVTLMLNVLQRLASTGFMANFVTQTSIAHLPKDKFEIVPIPLPPTRAEQEAIAEALTDADALIESLEQLLAKKRQIKQGMMQELLTGKRRLPGFGGEWERILLGDHVKFFKTGSNSRAELTNDGDIKYLHYGDIHTSHRVQLDARATSVPEIEKERVRNLDRLESGDLVLVDASEDLDGVGKSVEITDVSDLGLVAGLHTIAARFDKDILADGFKRYLQFCPEFSSPLKRLAVGTKVYATSRAHIASIEMCVPGIEEQSAIATILSDMDAELAALEAKLAKARQIKQGMMQELLTGRIRLPVESGKLKVESAEANMDRGT